MKCMNSRLNHHGYLLAQPQKIKQALAAPAQHNGVETALLQLHKAEHLQSLYSLSLFSTPISTRQAVFMLDDMPDADSALQVS